MSEPSASPAKDTPRPTSELALRVASGIVLAVLALSTAWLGGWLFGLFWTIAAIMVLREFLSLFGIAERRLTVLWALGSVAIGLAGVAAEAGPLAAPESWLALALGALVVCFAAPAGFRLWAAAGVVYAGVIAVVPLDLRAHPAHGLVAVLWLFGVVWLTDIGAYFAGRAIGGPKLWPAVSPKKTWSGFVGGVLAGAATAVGVVLLSGAAFGAGWYSGPTLLLLSLFAAAVSQGGDLLESALKRRFHVKDSSHLIPGHGGFMDRLDAFWAVCVLLGLVLVLSGGPG